MRRTPSTRETVEVLKRLLGVEVKLVMEDPQRPGMAIGYPGVVNQVFKLSGRWTVKVGNQNHEIGKIDRIEIIGPLKEARK